jgi:hypothetical protein
MRRLVAAVTLLLTAQGCHHTVNVPTAEHGVAYLGGKWFDGSRFVTRTLYVVEGEFRSRRPARVDSTVDLTGRYVVPPFGDAHMHIYDPAGARSLIAANLRDGIFYLKDQANAPVGRRVYAGSLNTARSVDYVSANQGWTSPGGHPVEVIQRGAAMPGPLGAFVRDSLDPGLVMQVETTADIDKRWAYFLAGTPAPDFVKVILQNSEAHATLRSAPRGFGNRGIDPALLPYLIARAKSAGLHVSAHVFTAADFRAAVDAGVTHLAHLPGGPGTPAPYFLTDADAQNAARRNVTVATTISKDFEGDTARTDQLTKNVYAPNVTVLRRHRVRIVLGSDLTRGTAAVEAAALVRSGLFSNVELLRMWSIDTPRSIFPNRRIGAVADGYEASFLVLGGDPLADFRHTRDIVLRVKRGVVIEPPGP